MHLLISTLVYPGLIALLATVLAIPAAWTIRCAGREARPRWLAVVVSPLLMPSYLAYAGWGLVRAPLTPLGDWLAMRDAWVMLVFNKALAVGGLALWAWPVAALVMLPAVVRLPQETLDAMALEAPSWSGRFRARAGLLARPLLFAAGCVYLIMLGSAVPLHLAQIPTAATEAWLELNRTPDPWPAWMKAMPVVVVALLGAGLLVIVLTRSLGVLEPAVAAARGSSRGAKAATLIVWGLSVAVPLGLFLWYVRAPRSSIGWRRALVEQSRAFWLENAGAVAETARIAAAVGVLGAAITLLFWFVFSGVGRYGERRLLRSIGAGAALVLLTVGLMPGVLIGDATARIAAHLPAAIRDSAAPLIAGHLVRFGYVGALLGAIAAALEPRELRDLRRLDRAGSVRGWLLAAVAPRGGLLVGAAIAIGMLSFHEIESTIFLLAPGTPSLPQVLLEQLHFARDQRLAAAAANLLIIGLVVALLVGLLVGHALRRTAAPALESGER